MQRQNIYLQRYAHPEEYLLNEPTPNDLGMVIVIPSFKEKNILDALESIDMCDPTEKHVEVILVINQPEECLEEEELINQQTLKQFTGFKKKKRNSKISYQVIYARDLPEKHAGVGLARKIGMDEAIRRFTRANNNQGVIINFDADCTCSRNYLQTVENVFKDTKINGASLYFAHPLHNHEDTKMIAGIIQYELHLRYVVHALRYAGFPYAFHTVGSSMAVRASVYQQQGGMNKRKAGEDFYFLHKIIPLGNFTEISEVMIIPSIRVSDRVPFGTGKAMTDWNTKPVNKYLTFSPNTFKDLKTVISSVDNLFNSTKPKLGELYDKFPASFRDFVSKDEFLDKITLFQSKSTSLITFRQKFFTWMNGLHVLKYVHHCRDHYYPNIPVKDAGTWAIKELFNDSSKLNSVEEFLLYFRNHDLENPIRSDQRGLLHPVYAPQ